MKKFVCFLVVVLIIICGFSYYYITYKENYKTIQKQNMAFEEYKNKEFYGADLVTAMNRAMDSNKKNNIEKSATGKWIDNNKNSISIKVKMLDTDKIYLMEDFYQNGIEEFIKYYNKIKFKCIDIQYHNSTHQVKYMLFEQITT